MEDPKPVLDAETLYATYDRFVCGTTPCAGITAVFTGVTITGWPVTPVTPLEVAIWPENLGPVVCECGRLTASVSDDGVMHVEPVAR